MQASPELRQAFLIAEGSQWRAPKINETCCKRPALAALLDEIAETGPDALYASEKTEVCCSLSPLKSSLKHR